MPESDAFDFPMIKLKHQIYGEITCRVVDRTDGIATLWCEPLAAMDFDTPTDEVRYIYTIQNSIKNGAVLTEPESSVRYDNIRKFGCNQWPISTIRTYLNDSFINGFDKDFADRIVPTENELLISQAKAVYGEKDQKIEERVKLSDDCEIMSYLEDGSRNTVSITKDRVYLPSLAFLEKYKISREKQVFGNGNAHHYYWLMNPALYSLDEYSVYVIMQHLDTRTQTFVANRGLSNANGMNIHVSPIFRIKEEEIPTKKEEKTTNSWIWSLDSKDEEDQNCIERSKKVSEAKLQEYQTTLTHCKCPDFRNNRAKKHKPCKHMIALGARTVVPDLYQDFSHQVRIAERDAEVEREADKLAIAYGYYYLFHKPILSNADYDKLKEEYYAMLKKQEEQLSLFDD